MKEFAEMSYDELVREGMQSVHMGLLESGSKGLKSALFMFGQSVLQWREAHDIAKVSFPSECRHEAKFLDVVSGAKGVMFCNKCRTQITLNKPECQHQYELKYIEDEHPYHAELCIKCGRNKNGQLVQ